MDTGTSSTRGGFLFSKTRVLEIAVAEHGSLHAVDHDAVDLLKEFVQIGRYLVLLLPVFPFILVPPSDTGRDDCIPSVPAFFFEPEPAFGCDLLR